VKRGFALGYAIKKPGFLFVGMAKGNNLQTTTSIVSGEERAHDVVFGVALKCYLGILGEGFGVVWGFF